MEQHIKQKLEEGKMRREADTIQRDKSNQRKLEREVEETKILSEIDHLEKELGELRQSSYYHKRISEEVTRLCDSRNLSLREIEVGLARLTELRAIRGD